MREDSFVCSNVKLDVKIKRFLEGIGILIENIEYKNERISCIIFLQNVERTSTVL
jgi:hypothetical protein